MEMSRGDNNFSGIFSNVCPISLTHLDAIMARQRSSSAILFFPLSRQNFVHHSPPLAHRKYCTRRLEITYNASTYISAFILYRLSAFPCFYCGRLLRSSSLSFRERKFSQPTNTLQSINVVNGHTVDSGLKSDPAINTLVFRFPRAESGHSQG